VERAVITAQRGQLRFALPQALSHRRSAVAPTTEGTFVPEIVMRDRERANLQAALEQSGWKVSGPGGAAAALGIAPTTLNYRIRKFGLRRHAPD
ncbi:MAG: helix-turn-helix domain-containing protein, partial [Planctomycetota bacterium]